MRKDHPELAGWWWIFGWAWSEGYTPGYPPGNRGSHNAGKLLLRLRIKQSLECSQLKAVLEALQDTCATCECRSSPGLQGGVWGTPGGVCAPRGPQGHELPRCLMYSLIVTAGTGTSRQNVAMGCSVNVFKMKKGRINPNY